ncbi:MAG: NUDIX domain-containing protein [Acidimicrobiia bacterium]
MPSAGLVPYRIVANRLEILIAHPGGPFWASKQEGAWSIVKGEVPPDEEPLETAMREFREETGWTVSQTELVFLGEVVQKAGKRITAWAFQADFDPADLNGDTVTIDWHGRALTFPEIDEMRWCGEAEGTELLNPAQVVYYERLNAALGRNR